MTTQQYPLWEELPEIELYLENNMVQTIGSAGESVAAGAIFTLPALFLWAEEGDRKSVV